MSELFTVVPATDAAERVRVLTEWFYDWELRGRGWQVWAYGVDIEPPFRTVSFTSGEALCRQEEIRPFARLEEAISFAGWDEPFANPAMPHPTFVHIPLEISPTLRVAAPLNGLLTTHPASGDGFWAFEIVADGMRLHGQLSIASADAAGVDRFARTGKPFAASAFAELGLAREFLLPLPSHDIALSARALSAIAQLSEGELGALQILFKPVAEPWTGEMLRAALGPDGSGLFAGQDELIAPCARKISEPLYAVCVRIMGAANTDARALAIVDTLKRALCAPADFPANQLAQLPRGAAGLSADDLLARLSRRSGMILNRSELAMLVPVAPLAGGTVGALAFPDPKIRRQPITPQQGLQRSALLARFAAFK